MLRNVSCPVALSPRGNKLSEVANANRRQQRKEEPGRHSVFQECRGHRERTTTRGNKQPHPWQVVSHRVLCLLARRQFQLEKPTRRSHSSCSDDCTQLQRERWVGAVGLYVKQIASTPWRSLLQRHSLQRHLYTTTPKRSTERQHPNSRRMKNQQ